jgi:hypothetical protein
MTTRTLLFVALGILLVLPAAALAEWLRKSRP